MKPFTSSLSLSITLTLLLSTATQAAFAPNETQDPGCPPTDINCYVEMPTSYWEGVEDGIQYQEGTVHITGTEEEGHTLGPELITNGTFTGNADGWYLYDDANGSAFYDDNNVTVLYTGVEDYADISTTTDFTIESGKTYELSFDISNATDDVVFYFDNTTNADCPDHCLPIFSEDYINGHYGDGHHTFTFTSGYDGTDVLSFTSYNWDTDTGWAIDNVSLREVFTPLPTTALKVTGNIDSTNLSLSEGGYINFGGYLGESGYGFRDNEGVLQYKNSGDEWTDFNSSSSGPIVLNQYHSLYSPTIGAEAGGSLESHGTYSGNNIMLGVSAGVNANSTFYANFIGDHAGDGATHGSFSNFFGQYAGYGATEAPFSNFFGHYAGSGASNARLSNFLGDHAGEDAVNAGLSNFFGYRAGWSATNAGYSLFIGADAGISDLVNNTDTNTVDDCAEVVDGNVGNKCYSILLGPDTSTGGFSNSIAMGAYAINTATNQFLIGSDNRPIDQFVMIGSGGTSCAIDANGTSCSSDSRLKKNINDLDNTLDLLSQVRTVSYNWNTETDSYPTHIGFLAQDLQHYFPELVSKGPNDYLQVNYAGMTPILTKAIQEINSNITDISDLTRENTWRDALTAWLGDVRNGITDFVAQTTHQETLCVGEHGNETCITKEDLDRLLFDRENAEDASDESADDSTDIDENPDSDSDTAPNDTVVPEEIKSPDEEPVVPPIETPSDAVETSSTDTDAQEGVL